MKSKRPSDKFLQIHRELILRLKSELHLPKRGLSDTVKNRQALIARSQKILDKFGE